ncbi:MAG: 50S ribosomal protein L21 [Pseudomonadota bacterium]|nr:50S ribosomal protein L21 [Pseudomonadota bacterium]
MYAVIKTGGKQCRVSVGDIVTIEKIDGAKGDVVVFDNVLLVVAEGHIHIGAPVVTGATVTGEIVAQTKAPKIAVFHMKRRKGHRKKTGHRQPLTRMRIRDISLQEETGNHGA